jgi:hypothetical protein
VCSALEWAQVRAMAAVLAAAGLWMLWRSAKRDKVDLERARGQRPRIS